MPTLDEAAAKVNTQLSSVLDTAIETISSRQEIVFQLYVKQVLPLDGWIYWVNASILSPDLLASMGITRPLTFSARGSLHRQSINSQTDESVQAINTIIFTSEDKIDELNSNGQPTLYLGSYDGTQFAFSRMNSRYTQADIFHYVGDAVLSTMRDQIINNTSDIDLSDVVVSSSLPIWMGLNKYMTIYPAMLADQNMTPPFATAKCSNPKPVAGGYYLDNESNQSQLVSEDVVISITGLKNAAAMDFIRYVNEYTQSPSAEFGITNIPFIQDERVPQNELNAIAMRKTIKFEINYYQSRVRNIARQLITSVIPAINAEKN